MASFLASSAAIVYLVVFIAPRRLQYLLDNPLVRHCVRYSYELYIWHLLVLSEIDSQVLYYVAGYLSCLVASVLTFYVFEIPSFMLARSLARFMFADKQKAKKDEDETLSATSSSSSDEEKVILSPAVWHGYFL